MSVPVVLGGIKKADALLLIERDVSSVTIVTKNSTCSQDLTKEVYSFLKSKACRQTYTSFHIDFVLKDIYNSSYSKRISKQFYLVLLFLFLDFTNLL